MLPYNAFLWIASYLCQLRHWNAPEGEGCLRVAFIWLFYWGHHKRRLSGFLSISHWTIGIVTWVGHWSLTVISRACKPAEIIGQSIHTQSPLWTFESCETPLQVFSYTVCQCCTCSEFFCFGFALWSAVTLYQCRSWHSTSRGSVFLSGQLVSRLTCFHFLLLTCLLPCELASTNGASFV